MASLEHQNEWFHPQKSGNSNHSKLNILEISRKHSGHYIKKDSLI